MLKSAWLEYMQCKFNFTLLYFTLLYFTLLYFTLLYVRSVFRGLSSSLQRKIKIALLVSQTKGDVQDCSTHIASTFLSSDSFHLLISKHIPNIIRRII